ncbi:hypothetical protein AAEO57_19020 [Flavobacterium sp. DGU38]|uniref:Cleaved Adhesin Domain n=1 Tax=Flavobacterium calami TaxID=3139144 RepID=A0ABU9IV72_9FLAO
MRKIYFIILLICSINGFGQKYKFTFAWHPVLQAGESYTLKVGNSQIDKYYQKNNGLFEYKDYELQLSPTDNLLFELDDIMISACGWNPGQFMKFSVQNILSGDVVSDGCWGTGEILYFKPTEIVLNSAMLPESTSGNPPHYTICSGAQLEVFATIANKDPIVEAENYYPPSAFHWQYSIDNKETWINVPEYIVKNGVSTKNTSYNTPKLTASIDEIIGLNHKDFYNKIIYFQLGLDLNAHLDPHGMPYRNITYASLDYGVLYLKCAPVVDGDIIVKAPDCSYQNITEIKIPFDRDLEEGEELRDMSLYNDITPGTPVKTINTSVTYTNKTFYFPVDDVTLISKANYQIKYVAYKNDKPRALEISNFFTYSAPPALTFKINAENPVCNNDKVDITIEASGGTPPYYYDHLNGETEIIDGVSQVKRIRFDSSDITRTTVELKDLELKKYNIKVTDTNKCIEQ